MFGWLLLGLILGFLLGSAVMLAGTRMRPDRVRLALEAERGALQKEVTLSKERIAALEREAGEKERKVDALFADIGRGREEIRALQTLLETERDKQKVFEAAEARMREAFQSLSTEALRGNNAQFLQLAKESLQSFQQGAREDLDQRREAIDALLKPVAESLTKLDGSLRTIEKERVGAYTELVDHVRAVAATQDQLRSETANLVKALRQPTVRGRWGEIQLRRVVEMTGMLEHVDFDEQKQLPSNDGARLRPDVLVHLPGDKVVVVDAKAPLEAYLEAAEAPNDAERDVALARHARGVREHIRLLASKGYQDGLARSPEFIVMFLPGESFFSSALLQDPGLIEYGVENRVIPASPTTLISLLWAVSNGWRQERLAASAQKVAEMGAQLYERIRVLGEHFDAMHRGLSGAVNAYNAAVGSLESRVLVQARKFKELGIPIPKEIPPVMPVVEVAPKAIQAEELLRLPFGDDVVTPPSKRAR